MNVKSVEKENGKAKVVVEIDKPEFEQALNKAYAKCRKDIMLPGFRKGKAPRKMVESMYGATVFYEDAVNEIFPEIYTTGNRRPAAQGCRFSLRFQHGHPRRGRRGPDDRNRALS